MTFTLSDIVIGVRLIVMALAGSVLKRLPLTATLLYLGVDFALEPSGYGLIQLDLVEHSELLERLTSVGCWGRWSGS